MTEEQDRDRRRLRRYIEQEQLASFMNDTKWRELRMAMVERAEKPRYRVQCLLSQPTHPDNWDGDWYYHLPTFAWIEWLDIDPIYVKSRGHLLEAAPRRLDPGNLGPVALPINPMRKAGWSHPNLRISPATLTLSTGTSRWGPMAEG